MSTNDDNLKTKNAYVKKALCNFITDKFLLNLKDGAGNTLTQNKYAKNVGVTSSTITKLKSDQGYNIPFVTIYSILRFENYSLKKFFDEFENQFGKNIVE